MAAAAPSPTAASGGGPVAAVLVIGDEILAGRVQDANLATLARRLGAVGIAVAEARVVGDDEAAIGAALDALRARYAHVFTTGGIGPTHDDVTARAVARAFAVPLERNAEAERRLRAYYGAERINPARLSMADMPAGVELIDNPVSAAPGFRLANVVVLPGVPRILEAMLDPLVARLAGGTPLTSRALTVRCAEGDLAAALGAIQNRAGAVAIGSYPSVRGERIATTVVVRGRDANLVDTALAEVRQAAGALGFEHVVLDPAGTPSQPDDPTAERGGLSRPASPTGRRR